MRRIVFLVITLATSHPAFSAPIDLKVEPVEPDAVDCLRAMEQGQVIKTEDGITYIKWQYNIYLVQMSADTVSCDARMLTAQ